MPNRPVRPKLELLAEEIDKLRAIRNSRTAPVREVRRARIMLGYHSGESVSAVAKAVGMTRVSVRKWIGKAMAMGAEAALKDTYHRPKAPVITEEDEAWVTHLACCKPKDLGYAAEVWTRSALAKHVREHAVEAGHLSLARAAKATVHRILAKHCLHPEKVRYYLEKRDPEFEEKMRVVLLVHQEVGVQNDSGGPGKVITVSVDEKPGVQAIANTAPDLPPVADEHPATARDHEYKRLGTCSILAALDLHTGHVTARVERRHRSREFIALLEDLDAYYPPDCTIRIILDNHSAHLSKETQRYLEGKPNRFRYVLTPKHGSWLNIVEALFSKMARTFLRHIRVSSWEELKHRILAGIAEINASPVVRRWSNFSWLDPA
jgi:transposase